jgi:hypothetical protein
MTLDTSEAVEVYNKLFKIAQEAGLEWLIDDVVRQISLGKDTEEPPTETSNSFSEIFSIDKRRVRQGSFIKAEPYNDKEKLRLLVDALEAASCGLATAVLETFDFLGKNLEDLKSLDFAPSFEKAKVLHVKKDFLNRKEQIDKLTRLFQELREAL